MNGVDWRIGRRYLNGFWVGNLGFENNTYWASKTKTWAKVTKFKFKFNFYLTWATILEKNS